MTIASEITRLQTDKEAMRQAIIDKGVDVASNVSFDDYAACIAEISTGPKTGYIDLLVVGGGGSGTRGQNSSGYNGCAGGGGGGFIETFSYPLRSDINISENIIVGCGGVAGSNAGDSSNGGDSCAFGFVACGGGGGGKPGGSGGGGNVFNEAPSGVEGQGYPGGYGVKPTPNTADWSAVPGGGGGAGGQGECDVCRSVKNPTGNRDGLRGGIGKCSCISGSCRWYSGGGGSGGMCGSGYYGDSIGGGVQCGGGGVGIGCNNLTSNPDATYYGGGGGGGASGSSNEDWHRGGSGCQGVVILRYKTDGSCGICNTSYGGCKYTCGDYTIHCFTNTGAAEEFIPVFK